VNFRVETFSETDNELIILMKKTGLINVLLIDTRITTAQIIRLLF